MNVYDFDGTIYDGDSSIDFFIYCIKKKTLCVLNIIPTVYAFILYKLKIKNKEYFKSKFFGFIKYFKDINSVVEEFWKKKKCKIKEFYKDQNNKDDIVISASPDFLLLPISREMEFNLIATKVDVKSGNIIGKNCYGKEKVNRLIQKGIQNIDNFYSDSTSDLPLKKFAQKSYLVNKEKIIEWI